VIEKNSLSDAEAKILVQQKLRPHQIKVINRILSTPYFILNHGMGTGKSVTSLAVANLTKSKTIIICPSYLRSNWEGEIKKWYPHLTYSTFKNKASIHDIFDADVVIVGYVLVGDCEFLFEWADLVIVDECDYLSGMETKRTQKVHQFVFENNIKRLILASGTKIRNRVAELYSLMMLCTYNPKYAGDFATKYSTWFDFAERFSIPKMYTVKLNKYPWEKEVVQYEGLRETEELISYLKPICESLDTEDVLDLPPDIVKKVNLDIKSEEVLWSSFELFEKYGRQSNPKAKAMNALNKVPHTVQYISDTFKSGEQVVIYTDHVDSCKMLAANLGCQPITGETPTAVRHAVAGNFSKGLSRFLVATIGSFSTGVNDLICSNNLVFNDYPWTPGALDQAKYRIKRIGQSKTCIYHFILTSFQDMKILNKTIEKREVSDALKIK